MSVELPKEVDGSACSANVCMDSKARIGERPGTFLPSYNYAGLVGEFLTSSLVSAHLGISQGGMEG